MIFLALLRDMSVFQDIMVFTNRTSEITNVTRRVGSFSYPTIRVREVIWFRLVLYPKPYPHTLISNSVVR